MFNIFHLNPGADVHDVEQIVEDHLKTLIVQNFDVKKADSIFTEEGGVSISDTSVPELLMTSVVLLNKVQANPKYKSFLFLDSTMVRTDDPTSDMEINDL